MQVGDRLQAVQADSLETAAVMQQQSTSSPCLFRFAKVRTKIRMPPAILDPDGLGLNVDMPEAHTAVIKKWLVRRWGFGPIVQSRVLNSGGIPTMCGLLMPYSRETAFSYLLNKLQFTMAYRARIRSKEEARSRAYQFMDLFHLDCACFYGNWQTSSSWNPIRLPGRGECVFEFVLVGLQPGFIAAAACCDND